MDNIYIDQPWGAYLDTETDLTDATLKIRVKAPDGGTTLLDAVETATDNEIYAKVTGGINDEVGLWEVRPWILFDGDTNYTPGKPHSQLVQAV